MAIIEHSTVHCQNQNQNQNQSQNGSIQETHEVTVVMVPLPAQGHLNQLLHLSRLISSYDIPVHYVGTASHNRQAKVRVHGWDPLATSNFHFHEFSIPSYETPPPNPNAPTKSPTQLIPAFNASIKLREPVYALLQQLSGTTRRLVVIYDDLMPYVIQDVGLILNAEAYCFQSISAFTVYAFVWEQEGKPGISEPELLKPLEDLPTLESCFPQELMDFVKLQHDNKPITSGSLFNTCRAIEGPYLDLLAKSGITDSDKQWAIGPFNPVEMNEQKNSMKRHYCLDWLDKQAPNSVIFISFGSTTSISDEEAEEIAIGLDKSGQKFIWVLRDADKGDVFQGEDRRAQLPEGFAERTEGRGIVVRDWAPQLEILGHSSTGGFMSHCGWNSCIESISMGVPVAAWPMHSDQPRNAILLEKVLKVGLIIRDWSKQNELVTSITVENAVRRLMDSAEGEEMRQRASELSKAVKGSVMEGGVSRLEMDSFIAHIRR
ncbi:zeatin O-glucosyltransferase-like [Coffea eugenioides]|uniref:zeatin O-glucosyltransferase-like n=1 Tax=Coffea eugenioides TaxID=49369 RepID=UPI000F609F3D|nr:zeatin O-glucosyltransferase-like [Coffea eugenioides]